MCPEPSEKDESSASARGTDFQTTHWTLVMRVREGGPVRQAALEELCGLYWYPTYVFLRRRGYGQQDAEDLTQGFFEKLLRDETFDVADAEKGRLRTFLLCALERHLAGELRRQGALKRGGGRRIIAFEEMSAEERYANEPQDRRDPEWWFMRSWAQMLIEGVRNKLRETFAETDRVAVFDALLPFLLWDDAPPSYREVALKLDSSETAVRLLVFRMRTKFRELLRDEIGRTVNGPDEVADELGWLKSMLVR